MKILFLMQYFIEKEEMDTDMSERLKEKDRDRNFCELEGEHSLEDEDSIRRSTKKKKGSHQSYIEEPVVEVMSGGTPGGSETDSPIGIRSGISYEEKLLGAILGAYERAFFGSHMEEDDSVSSDEDDEPPVEGEVVIKFSRELKSLIRVPWNASLIVKVFGRSVCYIFLVNKLKTLWRASNGFSFVDLGLGFFLVKFESRKDFEEVLRNGPWFIGEHFLSIRPWVPDFRASEASVSSVVVWVRLPELPVEYYHKDSLMHIGSGLGPVLRVDFNTASGTRGRFARLCIQLDLDKPLMRTIRVGKLRLAVIYEGIGLLCFKCGKLGHKQELCPLSVPAEPCSANSSTPVTDIPEVRDTGYGPWMLVTRRKRQTQKDNMQAVVESTEHDRASIVPNAPTVEGYARGSGTAGTRALRHPPRGINPEKGKETKATAAGPSRKSPKMQSGPTKEHNGPSNIADPPKLLLNSLQSIVPGPSTSSTKPKEPQSPVAPSPPRNSCTFLHTEQIKHMELTVSHCPQSPASHIPNDKHQVGPYSDAGSTAQLVDKSRRKIDTNNGRHHRTHSEGSPPRLGVVQRESNPRLGRNIASSPSNRLYRSPSPNRFGLA